MAKYLAGFTVPDRLCVPIGIPVHQLVDSVDSLLFSKVTFAFGHLFAEMLPAWTTVLRAKVISNDQRLGHVGFEGTLRRATSCAGHALKLCVLYRPAAIEAA